MSEIQDASDFIKRQANQYKGFVALSDALDKIGPIANAAKEAAAARDAAVKAKEKAESELATVLAKIEDAHSMAADALIKGANEALASAAQTKATAEKQANDILDAAITRSAESDRKMIARQTVADADYFEAKRLFDLTSLSHSIATKDMAELQKEHDKLAKAIEAMKAKFA